MWSAAAISPRSCISRRSSASASRRFAKARANRPLIDGLWHEIEKPNPDPVQLDGYIDRLTSSRAAFQREQMHDLLGFAKTLDDSQRVQFLELVRTRLERGAMIPRRPETRPER
jgi:hypothetical protein